MSGSEVGKRSAMEPAERLLGAAEAVPDVAAATRMRRPAATTVGAVLVLLRIVAGVLWLFALGGSWNEVVREELGEEGAELDDFTLGVAFLFIAVPGVVVLVFEVVLAVLIYLGVNWPRIVVMLFATLSISGSFVAWWLGDQELHLDFTLVTLALDILVMLALSSRPARAYARQPRARKRRGRVAPGSR
ncbi:hypothetical protein [Agromyces sp. LHK192]|uniref:hypothetical protein n=1 Tax=Agromyces sp. LHK192 TaxID=2498704 RepID=UPI000FDACDAC|nr:hypothetical protein [Agromyces sp. LHK192]